MIQTSLGDVPYLTKLKGIKPRFKKEAAKKPLNKRKNYPVPHIMGACNSLNLLEMHACCFFNNIEKGLLKKFLAR